MTPRNYRRSLISRPAGCSVNPIWSLRWKLPTPFPLTAPTYIATSLPPSAHQNRSGYALSSSVLEPAALCITVYSRLTPAEKHASLTQPTKRPASTLSTSVAGRSAATLEFFRMRRRRCSRRTPTSSSSLISIRPARLRLKSPRSAFTTLTNPQHASVSASNYRHCLVEGPTLISRPVSRGSRLARSSRCRLRSSCTQPPRMRITLQSLSKDGPCSPTAKRFL